MITLLVKDFKLLFLHESKRKVLSIILTLLFVILFSLLEVYLYTAVINKIINFKNATFPFTVIFLFTIFIFIVIYALINANKLLFNKEDLNVISHLPIFDDQIILSKLIILLFTTFITSLVFIYPIQIAFGIIYKMRIFYYYLTILFNFVIAISATGLALILVYPYKLILEYLKKHLIIQFIVAIIFLSILSYLYGYVVELFINLITNNNIETIFSVSVISKLNSISSYLFPINYLVDGLMNFNYNNLLVSIPICTGVFILGVSISASLYGKMKVSINKNIKKKKAITFNLKNENKALIKKELTLIFKDSNNIFSYSGLLIIMPFLLYLVVRAMNTIFSSSTMAYYALAINNLTSILDIFIILMFVIVINGGATNYLASEGNNIRMFKLYPTSIKKKLLIKLLIPLTLISLSLFISLIVLISFSIINPLTALFTFIISIICIILIDLINLSEEISNKYESKILSNVLSYIVPIASFIFMFIMSFLSVNIFISYSIIIVLILIPIIYICLNFNKLYINKFLSFERF